MHEAIITRGNVMGNKELLPLIMVKENCALVHHGDCHKHAHTEDGRRKLAIHILYYEGPHTVLDWLHSLEEAMTTALWEERARYISEVYNGLQGLW